MNLSKLEKILQNPDTELKAQIQNQMREQQLKQAIENKFPEYNDPLRDFNGVNEQRAIGARICLQEPSILRHADHEIMKQAGWVSITDAQRAMTEYYKTEGCGCCGDYEGHKDATNKIGELLNFTPYSDGSGYDLNTPKQ